MTFPVSNWATPENIETMKRMWMAGDSASQIAFELHVSRNAVMGKVHRMKLERPGPRRMGGRPPVKRIDKSDGKRGNAGLPGQASARSIIHRQKGRERAAARSQQSNVQFMRNEPFRPGTLEDFDDGGVDATYLIAFSTRKIGRECSFIPGDPRNGAKCCGQPVMPGSEWCEAHHARVYGRPMTGSTTD